MPGTVAGIEGEGERAGSPVECGIRRERGRGPAQRLRNFGETREGLCGNWVSEARVACFSQVDWGGEEGGRG